MGETHELKGRVLTIDLAQPRQSESSFRSDGSRDRDYYGSRRDYGTGMDRMGYSEAAYAYAHAGYYGADYASHMQRDYGYYDRTADGRGGYRYPGRDDRYYEAHYDNRGPYADRYGYSGAGYDYNTMDAYSDSMGHPMARGRCVKLYVYFLKKLFCLFVSSSLWPVAPFPLHKKM